ncbi:MAG: hypothetical protein JSV29_04070 [Candidatus Bathyarchaeota archaeon]|nr:MAG: hypothetical protein JSV29_04070 [Candidatus Bathyarchaeota archaeon]
MKTVKGIGLLAGVLTLIHGLYLILHFTWVFILIGLGLWRLAPPTPQPLALVLIDTFVYLVLSIGMILDKRRDFFLLTALWTIVGSALAVVLLSYKDAALNLLSFLIVFLSTYYHITKTNVATFRAMEISTGILALVQGVYLAFLFVLVSLMALGGGRTPVAGIPLPQLYVKPFMIFLEASMVIYLVLGAGIVKGNRRFLLYGVLWTILGSAPATYLFPALLNLLSVLTLFLSTYCYWAPKPKT